MTGKMGEALTRLTTLLEEAAFTRASQEMMTAVAAIEFIAMIVAMGFTMG